jgi:hypothetical protein
MKKGLAILHNKFMDCFYIEPSLYGHQDPMTPFALLEHNDRVLLRQLLLVHLEPIDFLEADNVCVPVQNFLD